MSVFSERFESSFIGAFLEDTIAELEAIDLAQLGADYREIVVRTKHIVTTVSEQLSDVDPEFLTATLVDDLKTSAQHVLEAAQRCKREGSWNNLTKEGDGLLHFFAQIPNTWHPNKSLKSTNRDLAKYKKDVGKVLADANAALEKLANATASVNERVAALDQNALESISQLDSRILRIQTDIENLEASRAGLNQELSTAWEQFNSLKQASASVLAQIQHDATDIGRKNQIEFEDWLRAQESQWSTFRGQLETNFTTQINQWSTEASEASNSRQSQFSSHLDEFKSQLSSLQAEHIRDWEVLSAQWGQSFADLETKQQRAISDSSEEASRAFQAIGAECTSNFKDLLEQLNRRAEATMDDHSRQGTELISSLREKDIQAKTLVGLIGDTGVTGNYQKIADRELKSANWMRRTAIGAIVVVTALVGIIIWEIGATEFVWEVMLFRLLAGLPLVGLAWYCGKESSRHRTNEERNRRIELELAALSPYLHQLPDDKAVLVRESLTAKYFGNESTGGMENSDNLGAVLRTLSKSLDPIIEFAKKFNK